MYIHVHVYTCYTCYVYSTSLGNCSVASCLRRNLFLRARARRPIAMGTPAAAVRDRPVAMETLVAMEMRASREVVLRRGSPTLSRDSRLWEFFAAAPGWEDNLRNPLSISFCLLASQCDVTMCTQVTRWSRDHNKWQQSWTWSLEMAA